MIMLWNKFSQTFFILVFLSIIVIGIPFFVNAADIYCFDQADCDNPLCPPNLLCEDTQPGCIVSCKPSGEYCPMDSACLPYSGVETETCGYSPLTPSCNISANPSTINQGQSSTLTWSSDANSNCTASGGWSGSKPSSGSETVSPSLTTTYTLTCTNNCLDGSDSRTCSVTVTVAPFRHENCCDNSGWDNVRRCGGCCGVAANCVGYDPSAIYYWHDSNEVWQCSYADNQNSRYNFVEDCDSYDGCVGTTYRDWYCSGGACSPTDYLSDPRCVAPNTLPRGYHDADEGVQDQSLCRAAGWTTLRG